MIIFNSNITRVNVHKKYKPNRFESSLKYVAVYRKKVGRKFLFFPIYEIVYHAVIRTGGVFDSGEDFVCELKDYESEYYYFEDGILYEKPHCTIFMNDGKSREVHFNTVDELDKFVEDLKSKAPHIEI